MAQMYSRLSHLIPLAPNYFPAIFFAQDIPPTIHIEWDQLIRHGLLLSACKSLDCFNCREIRPRVRQPSVYAVYRKKRYGTYEQSDNHTGKEDQGGFLLDHVKTARPFFSATLPAASSFSASG